MTIRREPQEKRRYLIQCARTVSGGIRSTRYTRSQKITKPKI